MKLKSYEVFILGAAVATLLAAVIFGGHVVKAQAVACTPGVMITAGSNGESTCGPVVPATWNFSAPSSRTLSLATAYQCTDPTKPCVITVNIQSTAGITISGGTTNTGNALVGSTNGVATGTGPVQCIHGNSNTGALTIGLALNSIATTSCVLPVPIGYYFAVRQIAGTISIVSSFENTAG